MPSRTSAPSPASSSVSSPKPHARFYRPDGNIVIQVENILFKVDLRVLHDNSPALRTIMPPVYGGQTRYLGFNDERPFLLREVKVVDFVPLLRVLYPSETNFKSPMNIENWISVLKLSMQFQMEDILEKAVEYLDVLLLDPIRKIAIWEEFHLDQALLISSYIVLCQRLEPLTLPMTMTIGLKNFTKLAAARDLFHRRTGCGACMHGTFKERHAVAEEIVTSIFSR